MLSTSTLCNKFKTAFAYKPLRSRNTKFEISIKSFSLKNCIIKPFTILHYKFLYITTRKHS